MRIIERRIHINKDMKVVDVDKDDLEYAVYKVTCPYCGHEEEQRFMSWADDIVFCENCSERYIVKIEE